MWHEMRHTREERSCPKSIHEYLRGCGMFVRGGQGAPDYPKLLLVPTHYFVRLFKKVIIAARAFGKAGPLCAVSTVKIQAH